MSDTIIVGTDGSPQAAKAVEWAAAMARRLAAELLVVHVFETDPTRIPGGFAVLSDSDIERMKQTCRERLETEWSEPARQAGVRYSCELVEGSAAGVLIDLAELQEAVMLVVGHRGRGGFSELLLGSVGHQIALHARVPVVIVPASRSSARSP